MTAARRMEEASRGNDAEAVEGLPKRVPGLEARACCGQGYFTTMGCRGASAAGAAAVSTAGLALALVENSLSTVWRWKLFIAQKGIRRAPVFSSGTP